MPAATKLSENVLKAIDARCAPEKVARAFSPEIVRRAASVELTKRIRADVRALEGNPSESLVIEQIGAWEPIFDKPRRKLSEAEKLFNRLGKLDDQGRAEFQRLQKS